jgi:hypothetical protein
MDKTTLKWIKSTLANDEYSSDEEMVAYFMQEGSITEEEARNWVAKRNFYSMNLVIEDEGGKDIGIYDPKDCVVNPLPTPEYR